MRIWSLKYLVLFVFCFSGNLFSQEIKKIADIFSGHTVEFENKYSTIPIRGRDEGLDVNYPIFKNITDTSIQRKLNDRITEICMKQFVTDSFHTRLFTHLKYTMNTYLSVHRNTLNQLGIYESYSFTPLIYDVDFQILSYVKPLIVYALKVTYHTQYQKYLEESDFVYYEVYYFNTKTGKEYRPKDVFLPAKEKELNEKIKTQTASALKKIELKMEDEDDVDRSGFYNDAINDSNKKEPKITGDFSAGKDCISYISMLSFACHIPKFTPCTKNFLGHSVEVNFTLAEIKPYLNPKGPFGFLITMPANKPGKTKNFDNPLFVKADDPFPKIISYDRTVYTIKNKAKQLTVMRKQVPNYPAGKADSVKSKLHRILFFNQAGKITEARNYADDEKIFTTELFVYDKEGNLSKKTYYDKGKITYTEDYYYDKNGNLLDYSKTESKGITVSHRYLYSDKFIVLQYSTGSFKFDENPGSRGVVYFLNDSQRVQRNIYLDNTIYNTYSEYNYKYNKKGKLSARYSTNQSPVSGYIYVYDTDGNLLTYEYDSGRYFFEYRYDESGNFTQELKSDGKRNFYNKKIQYNIKNLPEKMEIFQDNTYTQIYTFTYEFW